MRAVLALIVVAGCAEQAPIAADAAPAIRTHAISWSLGTTTGSVNGPMTTACGDVISHPCPWLLWTTTLDIDLVAGTATWGNAIGGHDVNGFPAEHRGDFVEPITIDPVTGGAQTPQRGDDGGLRHVITFIGNDIAITWTLFNVAGDTTFHLTRQ